MALIDSTPIAETAAADLTTKLYRFGKYTSTGINVCTVQGEKADGVIGGMMKRVGAVGDGVDLYIERKFTVQCGGSFNKGDELTTDANGKAIAASAGDYVNGIATEAGVLDRQVSIKPPYGKPGTSAGEKYTAYAAGGAISPTDSYAAITAEGTALTLADGAKAGHQITIYCVSATGDSTLTIATPEAGTKAKVHYHAAAQLLTLVWTGAAWRFVRKNKTGALTTVIGTTLASEYGLTAKFNCSVTGTVSSTGTKALPDGDFDGEKIEVRCTVAASTPVGNIDGNFSTLVTAANTTHLTAVDATTDYVVGMWSSAAASYLRISDTGITFN